MKPACQAIFRWLFFITFISAAVGVPAISLADDVPFSPGERLTFALRWTVVPAGTAVLEVLPMKTVAGKPAYHFRLTANSNKFVDVFYKVRDRIDAYASADMSCSVGYRKKQREGEHHRDVKVLMDWNRSTAHYTNGNEVKPPVELAPGTFDPLSVFYYARTQAWQTNGTFERPVTDGVKCVVGKARIVKRETITTPAGRYDTFLIEPELKHIGGVFKKSKKAKIRLWVTADERRIPVKIASKVAVGSFVGELISLQTNDS